jgi:hypothetical protein
MKHLVDIAPLGTGVLLPAIVVGYEVTQSAVEIVDAVPDEMEVPSWIWFVSQQAGGYCMEYPSVLGAMLRIESSQDFGKEVAFMVRGLQAMAEDPDEDLLQRDYPALASLVLTWGEAYPRASIEKLANFLARYIRLPPIASGIEAFIRFQPCDPLDYLECWKMLQYELPGQDVANTTGVTIIDDSNVRELVLREDELLSAAHLDALQRLAAAAGLEGPPSMYLLWENSD